MAPSWSQKKKKKKKKALKPLAFTLRPPLKNHEWDQVPDTLLLYRNPGSHFEEGLRRRRIEEGRIWSTP